MHHFACNKVHFLLYIIHNLYRAEVGGVSSWISYEFVNAEFCETHTKQFFRKFTYGTGTPTGVPPPTSMSEVHFHISFSAFSTGY
ncbi:hypothetical protein PspLS_06284 [Pyricularia sp. CBS 133598]|nr:hypothetical protein PspLS_06284 [Pyricularia sp. CBS 133598]